MFLDYRTGKLQQPAIPQSPPEALRLAAELAEERDKLKPEDLFAWLSSHQWIYRRAGGSGWIAYQDKLQTGYLEHKVTTVTRPDGSEKTVEQVLVTPKGLAKLAKTQNRQEAA